ncbi:MAG TPA: LysR family transcriptional regulator [Bryobacteraceae bacterium]|nr:LysR family transcriptional regulator [Bryobacteraceae bacterium]
MGFDHLRLFRDIAQSRSLSKAAALNGVSQSAASQHVQELERELGVTLLDRATRPLMVTEAGRLYAELCRDVLRRWDEFDAAVGQLKTEVEGTVRVASIYSVGLSEMSQLEQEFLRRHSDAKIEVEYLRPEKVLEAVVTDRADLGLMSYAEPNKEITVLPWREEQMVVAASPYHPIAQMAEVTPQDLDGVDFVGFDEDLPIRRDIDRFFRDQHVHVNLRLHFDNLQMIKEAVAHGSGVSIMPARIMEAEVAQGRLIPIPIAAPDLYRPVRIIHRRKKRFHPAAQAFLQLLQEQPVQGGL